MQKCKKRQGKDQLKNQFYKKTLFLFLMLHAEKLVFILKVIFVSKSGATRLTSCNIVIGQI